MKRKLQSEPLPAPSPDALMTPAELALRLRVRMSWVKERTRTRNVERDDDPLPVVRLSEKVLRFDWPSVVAWLARRGMNPVHKSMHKMLPPQPTSPTRSH
jgi:hypothetical protein